MATTTLRPNATRANEANLVGTATSAHAALSDNSDATYVEWVAGTGGTQRCQVDLDDLTLPSGALIKQVRLRFRGRHTGGSWTQFDASIHEDPADILPRHTYTPSLTSAFADYTSPWWTSKPGGGAWTDAVVDGAWMQLADETRPNSGFDIAEAYVDVVYNERPVGDLTAPTGIYTDTSAPSAQWTYSDPESDPQTAFQVIIEEGDQTAQAAPGAGTQAYDSGKIFSSSTSHSLPALENGIYTVWLRVWQADVSGQEQHSTWDAITYTLDVAPPAVPTPTAVADDSNGRVILTADSTSAAGEEAEEYDFHYSDDGGASWTAVRVGTEVPPNSGINDTIATVYDYEAPPNTQRTYRARAARYSAAAERLVSSWSATKLATVRVDRWWLKDPVEPDLNMHLSVRDYEESGDRIELELQLRTREEWDSWVALWNVRRTLLLQTSGDDQWYVRFVGDRAAVFTPLGRDLPVVVDDGTDPHPAATLIRGTTLRRTNVTAVIQPRP